MRVGLAEAAGQGLHVGELVVNGLRKLVATLLVEAKGFPGDGRQLPLPPGVTGSCCEARRAAGAINWLRHGVVRGSRTTRGHAPTGEGVQSYATVSINSSNKGQFAGDDQPCLGIFLSRSRLSRQRVIRSVEIKAERRHQH
jgi:hypothetical protein